MARPGRLAARHTAFGTAATGHEYYQNEIIHSYLVYAVVVPRELKAHEARRKAVQKARTVRPGRRWLVVTQRVVVVF